MHDAFLEHVTSHRPMVDGALVGTGETWLGAHALERRHALHREFAFEKALMVKDRFKGRRTKYYVLKAFSSTAEEALGRRGPAEEIRPKRSWPKRSLAEEFRPKRSWPKR